MKTRNLNSLWMLVAGLFFAIMGALVKVASVKFTSAELVFYRSIFGLVFVFLFVRGRNVSLKTPHWKRQLSRSLFGFTALLLFFYAISALPLATAVTLNYTSPIFLALLTLLFIPGQSRPLLNLAIVIGFIGAALLLQPSFNETQWFAGVLGLLSGFLAGVVYLQISQMGLLGEPSWRTVFYFTLTCTIGGGIWMMIHEFHVPTRHDFVLLFAMGACATVAQLAMTRAYGRGNPLVSGSLAYSTVILASLFGVMFWGETLSLSSWLGIALIILSGIISTMRLPGFKNVAQTPKLSQQQEN